MLCSIAKNFPPHVANLLERDRDLTRNFREETVTDLLMASLVGMENFGIRVDYPDEPTTGGDMDWIFAAPFELKGGRYLRLLLQAKRARVAKNKHSEYYYYEHLDHGNPKGSQAQTLLAYATSNPGGISTCPLYILYHPLSALSPAKDKKPAVEGVNLVFADQVAPVVNGGCSRSEKKVSHWRDKFMPLSTVLCWPTIVAFARAQSDEQMELVADRVRFNAFFHPDLVADRLNSSRESLNPDSKALVIGASRDIPNEILRATQGQVTPDDRSALKRPRVIFSTNIPREFLDPKATE